MKPKNPYKGLSKEEIEGREKGMGKQFFILAKHWCRNESDSEKCNCITTEINRIAKKLPKVKTELKYTIEEFDKAKESGEFTNCTEKLWSEYGLRG